MVVRVSPYRHPSCPSKDPRTPHRVGTPPIADRTPGDLATCYGRGLSVVARNGKNDGWAEALKGEARWLPMAAPAGLPHVAACGRVARQVGTAGAGSRGRPTPERKDAWPHGRAEVLRTRKGRASLSRLVRPFWWAHVDLNHGPPRCEESSAEKGANPATMRVLGTSAAQVLCKKGSVCSLKKALSLALASLPPSHGMVRKGPSAWPVKRMGSGIPPLRGSHPPD